MVWAAPPIRVGSERMGRVSLVLASGHWAPGREGNVDRHCVSLRLGRRCRLWSEARAGAMPPVCDDDASRRSGRPRAACLMHAFSAMSAGALSCAGRVQARSIIPTIVNHSTWPCPPALGRPPGPDVHHRGSIDKVPIARCAAGPPFGNFCGPGVLAVLVWCLIVWGPRRGHFEGAGAQEPAKAPLKPVESPL